MERLLWAGSFRYLRSTPGTLGSSSPLQMRKPEGHSGQRTRQTMGQAGIWTQRCLTPGPGLCHQEESEGARGWGWGRMPDPASPAHSLPRALVRTVRGTRWRSGMWLLPTSAFPAVHQNSNPSLPEPQGSLKHPRERWG